MSKLPKEDGPIEQVPGATISHSYESALHVVASDAPEADDRDAKGTEIGAFPADAGSRSFDDR
jgi:hypothetical protein